ncbi:hypothetical protein EauM23_00048 [Exiguobacterium phage vB_EauM-23]|nr:hypothetical protein EauM23_00048 [Exiguobacterium phage vB_EauM-23]
MSDVLKKLGETMYKTKLSKGQIVVLIAEMNGVSRQSVYSWLKTGKEIEQARINAALDDIIKQGEMKERGN